MPSPAAALLLVALAGALAGNPAGAAEKPRKTHRAAGPVRSAAEAKAIAERETGGVATGARRTNLNGSTCGWEVDVHMPGEKQGWRCIVDCDTHSVHTKDRIPNPPRGHRS
jgi:hypothetical protein